MDGCTYMAAHKVTLGGNCLPLLVTLSGLVPHPLERQDSCLWACWYKLMYAGRSWIIPGIFCCWHVAVLMTFSQEEHFCTSQLRGFAL